MSQEKIWDYFQNEGVNAFADATPRYDFLAKRIAGSLTMGACVLNIGAGSGHFELLLKRMGFVVSTLDPSERAIERLRQEGIDGRVGFAEQLPFDVGTFDAVIASEVLEHLDEKQCELALSEIARVLRADGLFIGTVPFNEKLADGTTVCPECGHRFHRWGHRRTFASEGLASLLGSRFRIGSISTRSFVPWGGGLRRFLKSLSRWILGRMGEQAAVPHLYFECRAL